MTEHFDLLVVGAGSAGVRASRIAANLGAKVGVVEARALGGTCVNVGCIPKKLYVYASQFSDSFKRSADFGWSVGDSEFNWSVLRDNTRREIERLNGVYGRILAEAGVTIIEGQARLLANRKVAVAGKVFSADHIILAVGGSPFVPDIAGIQHVKTSDEFFSMPYLPASMVVVGGGYIACEFASLLNGMGVQTHLLYRGEQLLRGFDRDIRDCVARQMQQKGVHLHLQTDVAAIDKIADDQYRLTLANKDTLNTGGVLYATGRKPLLAGLGLENTKVQINAQGAIVVDEQYQTHEAGVYALGDAIDRMALTPVALAEGMDLAHRLFGAAGAKSPVNYEAVPTAVFTQPNVASVGLTQEEAGKRGLAFDVYRAEFTPLPLSLGQSGEKVMVKLLVEQVTDKVLGCHMVGNDAGEIIQGLAVAMTAGATKSDFDRTLGIHPTVAEEFVTLRQPLTPQ